MKEGGDKNALAGNAVAGEVGRKQPIRVLLSVFGDCHPLLQFMALHRGVFYLMPENQGIPMEVCTDVITNFFIVY